MTVLFFVTIVLDEIRPKVKCIHPKLIMVCPRLQAVKKKKNRETAGGLKYMFVVSAAGQEQYMYCKNVFFA